VEVGARRSREVGGSAGADQPPRSAAMVARSCHNRGAVLLTSRDLTIGLVGRCARTSALADNFVAAKLHRSATMSYERKMYAIWLAVGAPAFSGTLATELFYHFNLHLHWFSTIVFATVQLGAAVFLFWVLKWKLWIKIAAVVPFVAFSFASFVFASLFVAASNGDGL
jgi:hypothetical protein